ncbi:O-antigen ligase [Bacillus sp. E214]|uniref:O-antigen ligase family protein n=1 Tax=Bacillus sp. E214 TaxID=2587156 RepID=UPI0011E058E2|nr:O-antigen ligase family protein [Bacillus sp. E214]
MNVNQNLKYNFEDLLVILSIISLGMADINGLLPINLSQIFVILLSALILMKIIKKKELKVNKGLCFSLYYILLVTFIININGIESLKSLIILIVYLFTFYNYLNNISYFKKFILIMYNISFYLALIGVIQELAYLLNIEFLYDFSFLGVNNAVSISGDFLRVTSLMTEPAHLAIFMVYGVSLMTLSYFNDWRITKNYKNIVIFICTLLTFSMIVYFEVLLAILVITFVFGKNIRKKVFFTLGLTVIITFIVINYIDSLLIIRYKFESLFTLSKLDTNNLSSFAVISNFKIAIEKLKDGFIFGTGLDSHARTYFEYIDSVYSGVVMYLNYEDGASLYIRILSEFGLIGFLMYLFFIVKSGVRKFKYVSKTSELYITNRIGLICLVCYGVRMAIYVHPYFILMLCLVIITNNRLKKLEGYNDNSLSVF